MDPYSVSLGADLNEELLVFSRVVIGISQNVSNTSVVLDENLT